MKRTTLETKGLLRISRKLSVLSHQISQIVPELLDETYLIERNHKNIVAAHKAHTTMAKKGKTVSPQRTQRKK